MSYRLEYNGKYFITLNQAEWEQALSMLDASLAEVSERADNNTIRRKQCGICAALRDTNLHLNGHKLADWLMVQWPESSGNPDYPVEAHRHIYERDTDKWVKGTEDGDKRRRLLKYLVDSVKELRS